MVDDRDKNTIDVVNLIGVCIYIAIPLLGLFMIIVGVIGKHNWPVLFSALFFGVPVINLLIGRFKYFRWLRNVKDGDIVMVFDQSDLSSSITKIKKGSDGNWMTSKGVFLAKNGRNLDNTIDQIIIEIK